MVGEHSTYSNGGDQGGGDMDHAAAKCTGTSARQDTS